MKVTLLKEGKLACVELIYKLSWGKQMETSKFVAVSYNGC